MITKLGLIFCTVFIVFPLVNPIGAYAAPVDTHDCDFLSEAKDKTDLAIHAISDEFNLPSFSVAIAIDNNILYQQAIGYADVKSGKPATINTQYSIGSVAKSMTGIALMRLVRQGKARIADKLKRHDSTLDAKFSQISLRQLASHTAGIKHDTPERNVLEFDEVRDRERPAEVFVAFKNHPLLFAPGDSFKYSSNGYILLSGMIESMAEKPFDGFLQAQVFRPLNMTNTRLDNSINSDTSEASYYELWQREEGFRPATKKRDRSFLFGAGGYLSTPTDMVRMASALFNEHYLEPEFVEQMLSPATLNSGTINDEHYAIGWRVGEISLNENEKVPVAHHGGVTDKAATAYLFVIPEKKAAVAFTTNMVPARFWRIRGKVARILLSWINKDFSGTEQ